jgi:2-polyprenyl-3-methyl-5-hydroxy-6-metoxy-1,4-benzoquinol methylase
MSCSCCDGPEKAAFDKRVMQRYVARYVECTKCRSLRVEAPHWLDEAYRDPASADRLDSGALWRTSTAAAFLRAQPFPDGPWLDFGSGQGLLGRELREHGKEVVDHDPPRGVHGDLARPYAVIVLLEVLEHQVDPRQFLADVSRLLVPDGIVALSTWLRNPNVHGSTWSYLAPQGGQHVFFPTLKGFEELLKKVGLRRRSSTIFEHGFQIHLLERSSK